MGIWSFIHDFYSKWKPEIKLYGIGFLLLTSALVKGKWGAAIIIFAGVVILDAMRRWGEPYRQVGEKEFERRRQLNQEIWAERMHNLVSRFRKEPPPLAAEPAPEVTRLIPAPRLDGEDPPESPEAAPLPEPEKTVPPVMPPVTHDT
jgi:hypothetical protein